MNLKYTLLFNIFQRVITIVIKTYTLNSMPLILQGWLLIGLPKPWN